MEMVYKKADISALDEVYALISAAVLLMNEQGIDQWDEVYPSREDIRRDIERGELTAGYVGGDLAVIYVLSRETDEQYANGSWTYSGSDFMVIHRLCVSPSFQHRGIAGKCLRHIEKDLAAAGIKAVWLDVFTQNPYALRLYAANGYAETGRTHWRKGEFLLMEKLLDREER